MELFRAADSNTFIAATPSFSSLSSSDLDTESNFSFFPDNSISLGTLIGIRADPPLRRSLSCVHPEGQPQFEVFDRRSGRTGSSTGWWNFIRCAGFKEDEDGVAPSLGHFLQAERRAGRSGEEAKVYINIMYEEGEGFPPETNPLFFESILMAAPPTSMDLSADLPIIDESPGRSNRSEHGSPNQSQGSCVVNCVANIWGLVSPSGIKASPCTRDATSKPNTSRTMAAPGGNINGASFSNTVETISGTSPNHSDGRG